MEQKSLPYKTAYYDFHVLYTHLNGDSRYGTDEVEKAYDTINKQYKLKGYELKLIIQLVHCFPNGLACKKIAGLLKLTDGDQVTHIVESLLRKDFIYKFATSAGIEFILLSTDATSAFNTYEPFGSPQEVDFVDLLRKTEEGQMLAKGWVKKFKDKMDKNMPSDFVKGWSALKAYDLNNNETRTLCIALRHFILHFTIPIRSGRFFNNSGVKTDDIFNMPMVTKDDCDALVQKGFFITKGEGYVIAPKVAGALLHGHDEIVNYDEISNRAQVIKSCDIEKKKLFFSPESQEEIEHLHYMLSKEGFEHSCSILKRKKRNPAIQSLLWGGPGTGKTETVKQIALETGRDIFLFDVAKVTASDWGETENLYRSLFSTYRYIVAVKSLTPILFINEADQILSRRLSNLDRSMDKAENTVSNILLQEFEDMHGILLATTNNAKILDEAFDRRFLFKTELQKPDAQARKSIWKSMIPELTEQEAAFLAEKYVMSGAQISNVATKRDLAELYYLGDRGLSYIEMLCGKELSTEELNQAHKHIGF